MAIFTAIKNSKQSRGALLGVLEYVMQEKKTRWRDVWLVTGSDCLPQSSYAEMLATKQRFHKTDGRQFYHFVQSFAEDDPITPQQANAIGLEFAAQEFPGFEVIVATHVDTSHLHNHFVVNSVSHKTGKKLHQNAADLQAHRQANDEICTRYGLSVLKKAKRHERTRRMTPGEYQAGLREESWKLDLIYAINDALEYATDRESFIENMELEGYQVVWTGARKHVTFITPEGRRCRDSSLHDETFLKENLELLFAYRQATDFQPLSGEPDEGWLGEIFSDTIRLGAQLTQAMDIPPDRIHPWPESKQLRREALKRLAHGQRLDGSQNDYYELTI